MLNDKDRSQKLSKNVISVKVPFGSQKMQFRHPDRCPLVTGFTVYGKNLIIRLW